MCIHDSFHCTKVYYKPIEAAIRWSGLLEYEGEILEQLAGRQLPTSQEFPEWPVLCLYAERLFDGMRNKELPYGRDGITCDDPVLLEDPELTIRHVDLREWMSRFYSAQKPLFLFEDADRESLALRVQRLEERLQCREKATSASTTGHPPTPASPLSPRSETTYLNIIAALLTLLLGKSPGGRPYSNFRTMESVIDAMVAHFGGCPGISERTLWAKLAEAKRQIRAR